MKKLSKMTTSTTTTKMPTTDLGKWMSNLPADIRAKVPINKLAIPASHSSGSYYLNKGSSINYGMSTNFLSPLHLELRLSGGGIVSLFDAPCLTSKL